jgi:hypothetical protein
MLKEKLQEAKNKLRLEEIVNRAAIPLFDRVIGPNMFQPPTDDEEKVSYVKTHFPEYLDLLCDNDYAKMVLLLAEVDDIRRDVNKELEEL